MSLPCFRSQGIALLAVFTLAGWVAAAAQTNVAGAFTTIRRL